MGMFSWAKKKFNQAKKFVTKSYNTAASYVTKKYNEASSFLKSTVSTASSWVKSVKNGTVKLTGNTVGAAAAWVADKVTTAAAWTADTAITAAGWGLKKFNTASAWVGTTVAEGKKYYDKIMNTVAGIKTVADKVKSGNVFSAPADGQSLAYRDYTALSATSGQTSVSGAKDRSTQLFAG